MDQQEIIELSHKNQQRAWEIIEKSGLVKLWKGINAEVNIIGSLKTGLLMHRDIDMHIYTEKVSVTESFSVVAQLADVLEFTELYYKNLIDTEEECLEWHARFNDIDGNLWKVDMIHFRRGSKYDGTVEKVTEAIRNKLTPEIKETILNIKYNMPKDSIIPGIEVYHGVFTGGVKSYEELLQWRKDNPLTDSLDWLP